MEEGGMMDKSGFYGNAFFCEESQMTFMKHFFSNDIYKNKCLFFLQNNKPSRLYHIKGQLSNKICMGVYPNI